MFLLIDIGGTNTRIAFSPDGVSFNEPKIISTPPDFADAVKVISQTSLKLVSRRLQAVAVGLPGPLDQTKTRTMGSHKLPDWHNKPLKQKLEEALSVPVHIENDAALVGLGEATAGTGQGFGIVAYHTISTGVGGVRIVDRHIDRNALGFEPGWQIIDADNTLCPDCQTPGRLEHLIGGAQTAKRFGRHPKDIDDPAVWDQYARWLALALNNTLVYWSPDIIILGGPMMRDIPIAKVRAYLKDTASFLPKLPPVEPASLNNIGGLHGALAFLQHQHSQPKQDS